jgi:hypothetical protein
MSYELKYKKYKNKYLELKNIQHGGAPATLYIKTKECEYTLSVDSDIFSQITALNDEDNLDAKFKLLSFNLYEKSSTATDNMKKYLDIYKNFTSSLPEHLQPKLIITKISQSIGHYSVKIQFTDPPSMSSIDLDDFYMLTDIVNSNLLSTPFTFNINTMVSHTHVQ